MKFNFKTFFISVFAFWLGFSLCSLYGYQIKSKLTKEIDFSPFFEAWKNVEEKYYNFSQQDREKMLQGAIEGMIKSLNDPYSDYLDPQETAEFEENLEGSYEGIGAEVGIRDDVLTIISPLKGTPAEKAGLMAGDKIIEINGEPTKKMSLTEAVLKIRGRAGTTVTLTIKRNNKIFKVKIKRAKIALPILDFKMLEGEIPYVQIYNFYEEAPLKFRSEVVSKIFQSSKKKMILDLRNNPGGLLSSAVQIAGFFVREGEIILKEKLKGGEIEEFTSPGPGVFSDFKIIILINKGSASASEILAGTIKEHFKNNAILIGEKTFGKGTVQEFVKLQDRSSLKITVASWLLPSGKSIEKIGIKPDIEVKMTKEDINKGRDPQLKRAIEEIKKF